MPFTVQQLIEGRQEPVSVLPVDLVTKAMALMTEHEFSQLPVVDEQKKPLGLITSDSILHALGHFGVSLEELRVSHAIVKVDTYSPDEDLFDLLDDLKNTYAVLIVNAEGTLIGIVTSYDTTEYFRRRAEDMMYVEDIETTLKDYIRAAFHVTDDADQQKLASVITVMEDLTMVLPKRSLLNISQAARRYNLWMTSLSMTISSCSYTRAIGHNSHQCFNCKHQQYVASWMGCEKRGMIWPIFTVKFPLPSVINCIFVLNGWNVSDKP
jgi:CBS domain-containing protein